MGYLQYVKSCILMTVLAIVIGLIMAGAAIFVDHLAFNFSNLFKIWAMITMVVLLVSIFLPYPKWGERFAEKFVSQKSGVAFKLLSGIIPSLVLNTFNTVAVSTANILYNEMIPAEEQIGILMKGILHDWPIMFVISYFAAFVAEAVGKAVADKYTK